MKFVADRCIIWSLWYKPTSAVHCPLHTHGVPLMLIPSLAIADLKQGTSNSRGKSGHCLRLLCSSLSLWGPSNQAGGDLLLLLQYLTCEGFAAFWFCLIWWRLSTTSSRLSLTSNNNSSNQTPALAGPCWRKFYANTCIVSAVRILLTWVASVTGTGGVTHL